MCNLLHPNLDPRYKFKICVSFWETVSFVPKKSRTCKINSLNKSSRKIIKGKSVEPPHRRAARVRAPAAQRHEHAINFRQDSACPRTCLRSQSQTKHPLTAAAACRPRACLRSQAQIEFPPNTRRWPQPARVHFVASLDYKWRQLHHAPRRGQRDDGRANPWRRQ